MNLTPVYSDTESNQAKLLSHLSSRPARVRDDVFVWNGCLIDRATAVVALLKINNQVPVGDSVKLRLYRAGSYTYMTLPTDKEVELRVSQGRCTNDLDSGTE